MKKYLKEKTIGYGILGFLGLLLVIFLFLSNKSELSVKFLQEPLKNIVTLTPEVEEIDFDENEEVAITKNHDSNDQKTENEIEDDASDPENKALAIITILPADMERDSSTVRAEVADTLEEQSYGLKQRISLPAGAGMIFVFEKPVNYSFIMKDTLIPLDVIFIDADGYIVDIIENMQPCDRQEDCPVYKTPYDYSKALEVNAGYVQEHNVKVGDRVHVNYE